MKKLLPALLLVAAAAGGLWAYGAWNRHVGALQATIKARDAAIDSLRHRMAKRDTVYLTKVDTLRVVRARTDSVLVLLPGDTVTRIRVDTVRQIVAQERLACDAVVLSCEARVATRDTLIDSLRTQLAAERGKDRLPLFHVKLPSRTASLSIGVAAGLAAGLLLRR